MPTLTLQPSMINRISLDSKKHYLKEYTVTNILCWVDLIEKDYFLSKMTEQKHLNHAIKFKYKTLKISYQTKKNVINIYYIMI